MEESRRGVESSLLRKTMDVVPIIIKAIYKFALEEELLMQQRGGFVVPRRV